MRALLCTFPKDRYITYKLLYRKPTNTDPNKRRISPRIVSQRGNDIYHSIDSIDRHASVEIKGARRTSRELAREAQRENQTWTERQFSALRRTLGNHSDSTARCDLSPSYHSALGLQIVAMSCWVLATKSMS